METDRLDALLKEIAALADFASTAVPSATMCGAKRNTPLHVVALRGDTRAVRLLLDAGADPNAADDRGHTPLHEALANQHVQVARMLVAAGSSLDAADSNGVSARQMIQSIPLWEGDS
ncbi:MAG TPA: ankyrin repeat domain-containing protein [Usitatibacteraceae bacterium]|nr:ankyrin repeat domain-containing protein [Usitatibacteraceae bacterium]